jgi:hypothetical protein
MTKRSMKRKLVRARIALNQTIHKILEINRNRKRLSFYPDPGEQEEQLSEELKVLNKTAEQQAHLVRRYEMQLTMVTVNSAPTTN